MLPPPKLWKANGTRTTRRMGRRGTLERRILMERGRRSLPGFVVSTKPSIYGDFCNIPMVAQHLRLDGMVTHPLSGVRGLAFVALWLNS